MRIISVTAAIAFLVYFLTLEPDLSWANFGGDGGELITAAVTLGIPHPPGYPVYVLTGKLFSYLPVGTIAYRFNLLSAVCMAISAGFVAAICSSAEGGARRRGDEVSVNSEASPRRPAPTTVPAVAAGLAFAFGSLVWGQAVIAEVYALNLAFVAAFLYFLIRTVGAGPRPALSTAAPKEGDHKGRPYIWVGVLLGLSITTHLTSLLLLPLALFLIRVRWWLWLLLGLGVGLLPLLLLPLLAQSGSPVIWGKPETLDGWWWLASAQVYRPNAFGLPVQDWPGRLAEWGPLLAAQFAYAGVLLPVLGFFGHIKSRPRPVLGLLVTSLLYAFYAFTYRTNDAAVLLLPALLLLSILLGFGLQYLGKAAIILPLALLWLNLDQPHSGYPVNAVEPIRPAMERLLAEIPTGAVVITPGDPTIAALWYFHHVEGIRPDIVVLDGNLFQFDWYRERLGEDYPFLQHLAQDDLPGFLALNRQFRPVCESSLVEAGSVVC